MFAEPTLRRVGLAALSALMLGAAPAALLAETPADTLVIADAIDDIVSIDPHEAFEFSDAVMGRPPGAEADPELFPLGNSGASLLDSGCLSLGSRGE